MGYVVRVDCWCSCVQAASCGMLATLGCLAHGVCAVYARLARGAASCDASRHRGVEGLEVQGFVGFLCVQGDGSGNVTTPPPHRRGTPDACPFFVSPNFQVRVWVNAPGVSFWLTELVIS
jgi:hypothetical protein